MLFTKLEPKRAPKYKLRNVNVDQIDNGSSDSLICGQTDLTFSERRTLQNNKPFGLTPRKDI